MAKAKPDYNDPLHISTEMKAFDLKQYDYYDKLDEEQKKKFSPYLMMRWGACVDGSPEISQFYAVASNEYVNQQFFELSKHKKLQWLTCCAVSPGIGKQKHYWLAGGKKDSGGKLYNYLLEQFPSEKCSDIEFLLQISSKEDIEQWLKQHGLPAKEIKELMQ